MNQLQRSVLVLLAGGALAFWQAPAPQRGMPSQWIPAIIPTAASSEEDPGGRARYDWLRLRDPATGVIPENIRVRERTFMDKADARMARAFAKAGRDLPRIFTLPWQRRGPEQFGGRTRAFAADVDNESILLAGAVSGGMWRSADGGASWTKSTTPDQFHSVSCIAQDTRPGRRATWYYGTGELNGGSGAWPVAAVDAGDGVYRSTDGGGSWAPLPSTQTGNATALATVFNGVYSIACDPSNLAQDVVYVAGYGAVMRSSDGGDTWSAAVGAPGTAGSFATDVAVTPSGAVYACLSSFTASGGAPAQKGVFRSSDGVTFTNITPFGFAAAGRIVLSVAPSNPNVVYFLCYTPGKGMLDHQIWKYTYLSGDGAGTGGSWENRSANVPKAAGNEFWSDSFNSQGAYDLVIGVHPLDENRVVIGGTNLYVSTDGFATDDNWRRIGGYNPKPTMNYLDPTAFLYPNHHPDQHALLFLRTAPDALLNGNDGGLFRTDNLLADSVVWTPLNNGYVTTQFYTCALAGGTGNEIVLGGTQDNGTYLAPGQGFPMVPVMGGDGSYCAFNSDNTSVYASSQYANIYRAVVNPALQIVEYGTVTPAGAGGFLFLAPFTLDPNDDKVMYLASAGRLWRNDDITQIPLRDTARSSINWRYYMNLWLELGSQPITAIGVARTPANRVYVGTQRGWLYRLDDAHTANPAAQRLRSTSFPATAYIGCICVDPENGDHVLIAFTNYGVKSIFETTDAGATWQHVSGNLEERSDGGGIGPSVRWVEMVRDGGTLVYLAGTSSGLYSTTALDGDATVWAQEGAGSIGRSIVDMIRVRQADGLIAVATHGSGLFLSRLVTGAGQPPAPPSFRLEQNYPNPFNPETAIEYSIASDTRVRLTVYDHHGAMVQRLVDASQRPGTYTIRFDAAALPSGVYFCRLDAGGRMLTRKMVALK